MVTLVSLQALLYYLFRCIIEVNVIAGRFNGDGLLDGRGNIALFSWPNGVVYNPITLCLYICDYSNSVIRKIDAEGTF